MGVCFGKSRRLSHASSDQLSVTLPPPHEKPVSISSAVPLPPRNPSKKVEASKTDPAFAINVKMFSYSDLKSATRNFRAESLIGEGGFGCVFKGWIDPNTFAPSKPGSGVVVAVKRLRSGSYQGHKEWLAEVNYLGQLRHENLVKLIGYCLEREHKLLVYEYMPRGSLENHLFRKSVELIPWSTRTNIAVGVARGLAFLHSLDANVIYRDLKASNILLDLDFNAKLSDFGLARDGPTGDKTHVSTRVMGTRGYAAPEYVATGHLTSKSDVYSYGVVLLELISGKRVMKEDGSDGNLVDWAKPFLSDQRRVLRIMDTRLGGQYPKKEAQTAAALVLQCLQVDPKNRPNMSDVLAGLEDAIASKDYCRTKAKAEPLEVSSGNLDRPTTPASFHEFKILKGMGPRKQVLPCSL